MLAPRPQVFVDAGKPSRQEPSTDVLPYAATSRGLSIPASVLYSPTGATAVLDAADSTTDRRSLLPLHRERGRARVFGRAPIPWGPVRVDTSELFLPRADSLIRRPRLEAHQSSRKATRQRPPNVNLSLEPSAANLVTTGSASPRRSPGPGTDGPLARRQFIMPSAPRDAL